VQATTTAPNGRVQLKGAPRPPATDGMSGRRALGLMVLMMTLFGLVVAWLTVGGEWRQKERLVAPGLRNPTGVALMREGGLVLAEAGLPDLPGSGRLTWVAADSRGTLQAGLSGVTAVAATPDERILVLVGACDGPLCRALHALDKSGRMTRLVELRGDPTGLAVGADGTAYVSDAATGELTAVSPGIVPGGVVTLAGLGREAMPRGLAVGPDGALYAALAGTGRVVRVAPDGGVTPTAEGLTEPVGVGFEPDGKMLVLERAGGAGRLIRVDPAKPADRTVVSADLPQPTSLLVAPDGRAYVTAGTGDGGELLQIRRLGPRAQRRVV
jgi:streptogramin lyase